MVNNGFQIVMLYKNRNSSTINLCITAGVFSLQITSEVPYVSLRSCHLQGKPLSWSLKVRGKISLFHLTGNSSPHNPRIPSTASCHCQLESDSSWHQMALLEPNLQPPPLHQKQNSAMWMICLGSSSLHDKWGIRRWGSRR